MEEGFVFVLASHVRLQLGHGTRVVVDAPVVKYERDDEGVRVKPTFVVREWNDDEHQQ